MTIELHTWNTPNGRKISVALEEMGLPYKVIPVDITKGDQMRPEFSPSARTTRFPRSSIPMAPAGSASACSNRRDPALSRREDRKILPQP